MKNLENIIWDFDGVILNSMAVRDWGFEEIFKQYPKNKVNKLLEFHTKNGGLSRYVKIRYFFEKVLLQNITNNGVQQLANDFSVLMKKELTNKKYLILETVDYIKNNYEKFNFHIASGSDQNELIFLCEELGIAHYFKSIHGSPTPKNDLVKSILNSNQYKSENTCLIGDSFNDYEASQINNISFLAHNNDELNKYNNITPLY
ncbi:HAD hydrolase-like protein [Algibacter sp.]|nr:HAD hydrolase-like protein [Algibacter sp.]